MSSQSGSRQGAGDNHGRAGLEQVRMLIEEELRAMLDEARARGARPYDVSAWAHGRLRALAELAGESTPDSAPDGLTSAGPRTTSFRCLDPDSRRFSRPGQDDVGQDDAG